MEENECIEREDFEDFDECETDFIGAPFPW